MLERRALGTMCLLLSGNPPLLLSPHMLLFHAEQKKQHSLTFTWIKKSLPSCEKEQIPRPLSIILIKIFLNSFSLQKKKSLKLIASSPPAVSVVSAVFCIISSSFILACPYNLGKLSEKEFC